MSFFLTVALIILFIQQLGLRDRVKRLEELARQTRPRTDVPAPIHDSVYSPLPKPDLEVVSDGRLTWSPLPPLYPKAPASMAASDANPTPTDWFFVKWFKEYTLIKIGGIFFFLGAAWFVSYAIKSGWISPELRILLGCLLAFVAYGLGWYRAKHRVVEFRILTALGTSIMLVTALVAHVVFAIFPLLVTLCLVLLSLTYTVYVAITTRSTWLAHVSALAGFVVPLFMDLAAVSLPILSYLLVLSVGLLLVGLRLEWRTLTLILLGGVLCYETAFLTVTNPAMLWLFVIIFSVLFLLAVTISLVRSARPVIIDIVTLLLLCVSYVFFVSRLAYNEGLAVFVATALISFIGYLFMYYRFSSTIVAVYLLLAGAGILIGTSFLLSGYTLTLAFIVELVAAFLLVTHLGLPEKMVWTVAGLYTLPLVGAIMSLMSREWVWGIWHNDAIVAYSMLLGLLLSTLWLIHKPGVAIYPSSNVLVAMLGLTTFCFAYAVVAVVTHSLFTPIDAPVFMYVWWALISLCVLYYAYKQQLPKGVMVAAAASLTLPVLVSAPSFYVPLWQSGIYHIHSFGVCAIVGILCLSLLLLSQQYYRDADPAWRTVLGYLSFGTVGYVAFVLARVWYSLLSAEVALVATYVSYAFLLYLLVSIFVLARTSVSWIRTTLLGFIVPVFLSLQSFALNGWEAGVLSPDAVGLFTLVVIFILLALGIKRHGSWALTAASGFSVAFASRAFFVTATLYSIGLVWSAAHTVAPGTEAVSLALFVYTVTGLAAYLYGKQSAQNDFVYLGTALLTIVVARLLLIDVWNMESVWRFVTLLVIGSLFIGAAFLERSHKTVQ